jgi:hypothetical protein
MSILLKENLGNKCKYSCYYRLTFSDITKVDQTRRQLYFDVQMLTLQILSEAVYVNFLIY